MTLIKCPECKKKVSNTLDKCLHCGFDLSNVSHNELKVKECKLDKKSMTIIVVSAVVIIVLLLFYKMLFPANGNVNKAVGFLKSQGYECEKVSTPFIFTSYGEYVCEEEKHDNRKQFIITWYGGVADFASDLINSYKLFDSSIYTEFYFYNAENDYVYISLNNLDSCYGLVMQDDKTSDWLCNYIPSGSNSDNHIVIGNKDLEVDYDKCNNGYDNYLNDLNDSLDDIRNLLDEIE